MSSLSLEENLLQLKTKGLKRTLRAVEGAQDREMMVDGRKVLNFCSNNYLGLANDPRVAQAALKALREEGVGAGASRLVCGNMTSHRRLEEALAQWKGTESCLVFNSGYTANLGIIPSLCGRGDVIFADKLNHASLIDGMILSGAAFKRYPHKDVETLRQWLKEAQDFRKRIVITDSVFSMDGDLAPLEEIVHLAKEYEAWVMIDEAHALGVLGKTGKGATEHFGLEDQIDIQMGTLSKSGGVFGAYCCGSKSLISFFLNSCRSFIYTTALPPSIAAAALKAIEIMQTEPERRGRLWEWTNLMRGELKRLGFDTLASETPIIPILVGDSALALRFSQKLWERGIFVQAIRPPTVPQNTARLRLTVMATHLRQDVERALEALREIGRQLRLI